MAADAHECIIGKVQTQSTEYKAVARSFAPERELPSDTLATSLGLFTGRRRLTPGGRSTPAWDRLPTSKLHQNGAGHLLNTLDIKSPIEGASG